jgi:hypothetical protein
MSEGDIVVVLGKLDDRVRDNSSNELVTGTLVRLLRDEVSVLLKNGDLWHGLKREVIIFKQDCETIRLDQA